MKKSVKRVLAFVVAAATVLTSVNLSTIAEAFPLGSVPLTPDPAYETAAFGDILVDNYPDLFAGEVSFLRSGALKGTDFQFVRPEGDLLSIDAGTKSVTAAEYTDSKGNTWTTPTAGKVTADGYSEDIVIPGTYTYTGSAFSVNARYTLETSTYSKAVQAKALNAIWYLTQAESLIEPLLTQKRNGNYELIISYQQQIGAVGFDITSLIDLVEELEAYNADRAKYILEDADGILDLVGGAEGLIAIFKELTGASKMNGIRQGIFVKTQSMDTANSVCNKIKQMFEEFYAVLYKRNAYDYELLDNAVWSNIDRDDYIDELDYDALNTDVTTYGASHPSEENRFNDDDIKTTLKIASEDVSTDMNRSSIAVRFAANVYNDSGVLTGITYAPFSAKIDTMADAATIEETITQLREANEATVLSSSEWSLYGVSADGYNIAVPAMPTEVVDGYTYTITYSPKIFTVTDWNNAVTSMYYGQKVALPTYESEHGGDESRAYTYKINGVAMKQGITAKITANTTITRLDFPKADEVDYGQIIADTYAGDNPYLAAALKSNAFITGSIAVSRPTDSGLVTIEGGIVTAQDYAASEILVWKPVSLKVIKDGVGIGTADFTGNTADVSTFGDYDSIDVTYSVNYYNTIPASEIQEVLGNMAAITSDAQSQLQAAKDIKSLYSGLYSLHHNSYGLSARAIVAAISNYAGIAIETADAAKDINNNRLDGNNLDIFKYVTAMQSLTSDSELLTYYYKNYSHFTQIANLAEDLAKISEDPVVIETAISMGASAESAVDSITDVANELNGIIANLKPIHTAINMTVADSIISSFAAAVLGAPPVPEYDPELDPTQTAVLSKSAPDKFKVTVIINTYDYAGTLVTSDSGSGFKTFMNNTASGYQVSEDAIADIEGIEAALAAELAIDTEHYSVTAPVLPPAGTILTEDATFTYEFRPNTYTINIIEGGAAVDTLSFVYGSNTVLLPESTTEGIRYEYVIAGANRTAAYTFTDADIATFTDRKLDVERISADASEEDVIKFIDELNGSVYYGADNSKKKIAYIPLDGDGESTDDSAYDGRTDAILMRLTPKGDMKRWLGTVATTLAKMMFNNEYTDIRFGGRTFVDGSDGKVSLQTFVDVILNSGITIDNFTELVDDDDLVIEDTGLLNYRQVATKQYPIYTEELPEGEVGAKLVKTTVELSGANGTRTLDFYMSMEDFNDDESRMADVVKLMKKIRPHVGISMVDGELLIELRNERLYQFTAASMILTGAATYKDFADGTVPSDKVGRYFLEMVLDLCKEQVNGEYTLTLARFKETTELFDISLGASLDTAFNLLVDVMHGLQIRNNDRTGSGAYEWRAEAYYDLASIINDAFLEADLGGNFSDAGAVLPFFKENIGDTLIITVNFGFALNPASEWQYSAFAIDPQAINNAGIKDKLKIFTCYEGGNVAINAGANSLIVLCDDIPGTLTISDTALLDLNGHTVGNLAANGKVYIFDGNWVEAGTVNAYSGTIDPMGGRITGFPEEDLAEGFIIDDTGRIRNAYYTFEKDAAGNVTVTLDGDALLGAAQTQGVLSAMVKNLALEIVLNMYGIAGLTFQDASRTYTLYDIDVNDVVGLYKSGDYLPAILGIIDFDDIIAFVNYALSVLFDFAGMDRELTGSNEVVRNFTSHEQHWDLRLTAANEDKTEALTHVTADIVSTDENKVDRQLKLRIAGEDDFKKLIHDLADITTESRLEITSASMDDVNSGKDVQIDMTVDAVLKLDCTRNNGYVVALARILTEANELPELEEAIGTAISEGNFTDLHTELNKVTLNESLKGFGYLQRYDFQPTGYEIADEKEAIYNGLFSLIGYIINESLGTDVDQTRFGDIEYAFGAYKTGKNDTSNVSTDIDVSGVNHKLIGNITVNSDLDAKFFAYDVEAVLEADGTYTYIGSDVDDAITASEGATRITVFNHDEDNRIFFNEDATVTGQVTLVNSEAISLANADDTIQYKIFLDNPNATVIADTDIDFNRTVFEIGANVPAGYSIKETVSGSNHVWWLEQAPLDMVCQNERTGAQYPSIKLGLAECVSGDRLFMIADDHTADADEYLFVKSGITFDLNGYKAAVAAMTVIGRFRDTTNSATNAPSGILLVDKTMFTYSADSRDVAQGALSYIPVYYSADGGYKAYDITGYSYSLVRNSGTSFIARFRPRLRSNSFYEALFRTDSGVSAYIEFDIKRTTSLGTVDEPQIGTITQAYKNKFIETINLEGTALFEAVLTTVEEQAIMVARPYIESRGLIIAAADKSI